MRQGRRKGLITVAAAGGVLATLAGGTAYADSGAQGGAANSPGVLSGNNVQVPVHVPVNVCGNTVNVVGALNPAFGNKCANHGSHGKGSGAGGSSANGSAQNSPGVGSGNNIQVPVDVPVNVCGNSVDVIGALNPAFGNKCENESPKPTPSTPSKPPEETKPPTKPENPGPENPTPEKPTTPAPEKPQPKPAGHHEEHVTAPKQETPQLAHTGSSSALSVVAPLGAGMLLGGFVLYRRGRAMQR